MAGSLVETLDHNQHRARRRVVEPFFSKRSVQALEQQIVDKVEKLLSCFSSALIKSKESGEVGSIINLSDAMSGLTLDVISDYCFGEPMGALDKENYGHDFVSVLHNAVQLRPLGRQFPTFVNFLFDLPTWIAVKLNKDMGRITAWMDDMRQRIDAVRNEKLGSEKPTSTRRTIFHELLEKDLPAGEKETAVLQGSAVNFLGAGTETTARNLAVTCFYVLQNPQILEKLRVELKTVLPTRTSRPSLPALEALPYLVSKYTSCKELPADMGSLERNHQ
jgi:cytochrome P450